MKVKKGPGLNVLRTELAEALRLKEAAEAMAVAEQRVVRELQEEVWPMCNVTKKSHMPHALQRMTLVVFLPKPPHRTHSTLCVLSQRPLAPLFSL